MARVQPILGHKELIGKPVTLMAEALTVSQGQIAVSAMANMRGLNFRARGNPSTKPRGAPQRGARGGGYQQAKQDVQEAPPRRTDGDTRGAYQRGRPGTRGRGRGSRARGSRGSRGTS